MTGLSLNSNYGTGLRMPTPGYSGTGFNVTPQAFQAFNTPTLSQMGSFRPQSFNIGGMLGNMGQSMMNRPQVQPQWLQLPFNQMQFENALDIMRRVYGGAYGV